MESQAELRRHDTVAVRCLKLESGGYSHRNSNNHLKMEADKHLKFHRGPITLTR